MEKTSYISSITEKLLKKYNEKFDTLKKKFDETEKQCDKKQLNIKKTMQAYLTDLKKLDKTELFTLTNLEKPQVISMNVPCNYKKNEKKITDITFFQDLKLVKKIIQYRKQEVWKELTLIQMYLSVYNNLIAKIINLYLKYSIIHVIDNDIDPNNFDELNVFNYSENDIENQKKTSLFFEKVRKLNDYKSELEEIIQKNIINNKSYLLKSILCKYIFLETSIKRIINKT
jgi:hypothetical protein